MGHKWHWCDTFLCDTQDLDMVFNSIKLIAAERNLSEANDDPCVFAMARCLPDVIPQTRSINLISSWISELHPFYPAESWWRIQLLTEWQSREAEIRCLKLEYDKEPI